MRRAITLMAVGATLGVAGDRFALEMGKPPMRRFPWLRREVNEVVNPWLLERHVPGGAGAEFGTLEHVGRATGTVHLTPVHPTVRGEKVLVPAPLGVGSQWAQNVLHAGKARLHLREVTYDLDQPELITISESGFYPKAVAAPFDHLGLRYVRLHVAASAPGAFTSPEGGATPSASAPLEVEEPSESPIAPERSTHRHAKREPVPA